MVAKKMPPKKMVTRKAPVKKAVAKKTTSSKPLKSGEGYLKPGSMASTKRVSKSKGGDLASERGVMREARQRNAKGSKQVEKYGWGVANMTYRDKSGKLSNAAVNVRNNAKIPKSGYIMMGDTSKKQPKKSVAKKSNVGSANAAEKRMNDKKQVWASRYDESNFSKKTQDFGKKNMKVASKYGKVDNSYSTSVWGARDKKQYEATTGVTSKRGNKYLVDSKKVVRRFRPDKTETTVREHMPGRKPGQRDAKFGPAPKPKTKKK
jgi:hypothetical protein